MDADQYGFQLGQAISSNFLMGLRENRAQQEQSLRERAFIAEEQMNRDLFPLKKAQIENQTMAVRLQAENQRAQMDAQRAELASASVMSPIMMEMDLLGRSNPQALMNYQIPDIQVAHENPLYAQSASALAKSKLIEYRETLLEKNEFIQDQKNTANTLLAFARDPSTPTVLKTEARVAAQKVRYGGLEALTPHEQVNILRVAEETVYKRSPQYIKQRKEQAELSIAQQGANTKTAKVLLDAANGLFIDTENRTQFLKKGQSLIDQGNLEAPQNLSGRSSQNEALKEITKDIATKEVNLAPLQLKFAQGAAAIGRGADPMKVISRLAGDLLASQKLDDTPQNRISAEKAILATLQKSGLQLPNFYQNNEAIDTELEE